MPESKPVVIVYCQDLFFSVRIQDVVERLGGKVRLVQSTADLAEGLGEVPVLAIVELGPGGQGEWIDAVQYARRWTRGVPIVAFGSHVDGVAREAARRAGCDYVWAKSRFVDELPALVERYVTPSSIVQGCDDMPNELVRRGLELFNQGQYYRCHDSLEQAWVEDRRACRDLYQGILQFAVALHHIERANYAGADKMFRRAINKFQRLPNACQGINVAALLDSSRMLRQRLLSLGPDRVTEFPRELFPRIIYPQPSSD
ncbi:MAG: DUF309 domain-containing protein [Caldilineales bacterium]|nr:DUF309 domain-containing protein [Caldilineales bacterium]